MADAKRTDPDLWEKVKAEVGFKGTLAQFF